MKKLLLLALICVLLLTGCSRSMNAIIGNEPSITGIVREVSESTALIADEDGTEYWVSLDAENSDSYTALTIGDEVAVYYDGNIAENYPMQINKIYAITLITPADRSINDRS